MIETGSPDQIKESILGNITWRPDLDLLKRVRKAFEAQELKVQVVTVKHHKCGTRKTVVQEWPVIVASFITKRSAEAALAKVLRATRAVRLSLFQFTLNGSQDGLYHYAVELRERE